MIAAAIVLLAAAGLLFVVRALRGPTLGSRIVALDALVLTILAATMVDAGRRDSSAFLDVVVVAAFVGFVATSAVARFIEQRGG